MTDTHAILSVLARGSLNVAEICEATGLTVEQVRMALPGLRKHGKVITEPPVPARYVITTVGALTLEVAPLYRTVKRRARKQRQKVREAVLESQTPETIVAQAKRSRHALDLAWRPTA